MRKRKNAQNGNDATKKLKVDTNKIKTIESVGAGGALLETPLINAKIEGVQLHLKPQNRPYLFNTGNQEASLKAGLILCGYGKGKWRLADAQSQEANPRTEVLFNLTGPDDFVAGMFGIHHVWFGVVDFNPQQMYKKNILLSIYGTLFFLLFIYLCVYLFLIYHVLVCLFVGYCFILFHCFIPTGLGICLFRLNFIYIRYL